MVGASSIRVDRTSEGFAAVEIQSSSSSCPVQPTLIVVLGMHRSGTSATTRALETMGANLGDRLMPSQHDNPKGYFEDLDINALNVELMYSAGVDWHALPSLDLGRLSREQREQYQLRALGLLRDKCKGDTFAIKDPRVARLMPFWQPLFDRLNARVLYVVTFRHPISVMRSLKKRDNFVAAKSYLLWLLHVTEALRSTKGKPRALLNYDRLMESPREELARLAATLGLELNEQRVDTFVHDFLEQGLRHTQFSVADLDLAESMPPIVKELFRALELLVGDPSPSNEKACQEVLAKAEEFLQNFESIADYEWALEGDLEQLGTRLASAQHSLSQLQQTQDQLRQTQGQLQQAQAQLQQTQAQFEQAAMAMNSVVNSTSWKLTAPLRWTKLELRKLAGTLRSQHLGGA